LPLGWKRITNKLAKTDLRIKNRKMATDYHKSILLNEIVKLAPKEGFIVDGTLGGGGHSAELFKNLIKGTVLSIDQDQDAINHVVSKYGHEKIDEFQYQLVEGDKMWIIVKGRFGDISSLVGARHGMPVRGDAEKIDFLLADIGVSSYQIDTPKRGFSFLENGPLDMRMDKTQSLKAEDLINGLGEKELERIFEKYGEEKYSKVIAREIVQQRSVRHIKNIDDIVEVINRKIGGFYESSKNPARRIFQALRIAVNNELGELESLCQAIPNVLTKNGIAVILTFHSLEKNIIESHFDQFETLKPTEMEVRHNPRAKSCVGYVVTINNYERRITNSG
jgi:16S rRNA (cytosine1402-N4)-methyltransferase